MGSLSRWATFFVLLACFAGVRCEVFTALIEMENLVYREKEMVAAVKDYLKEEEARLEQIRKFTQKLDKIHAEIPEGKVENYLGHPSNAYLLIKRFVKEWPTLEDLAKNPSVAGFTAVLDKHRNWFPDQSDLEGAINAIFRVQEIFKVKPPDFTNDHIPSRTRGIQMDAIDAFEIGRRAYVLEKFRKSKSWLETALTLWKEGRRQEDLDITEIFDYLSYVEYKLGNLRNAYNLTLNILMLEPAHERAQKNLKYYADELKQSGALTGERGILGRNDSIVGNDDDDDEQDGGEADEEVDWKGSGAYKRYTKICRSDTDAMHNYTVREQRLLKCWYFKERPWLYMRGIGVERLHVTPEVIYFRNVLTDSEIETVKRLGRPKLQRARIRNGQTGVLEFAQYRISERRAVISHPVTGNQEPAEYRISKSGWLRDEEDPVIRRISQRTEHLTGLTMSTAEELQVNTYGMGGHYEPHYDHAQDHEDKFSDLGSGNRIATMLYYAHEEKFPSLGTGNRIATFLYYMSDVELGGGTAFVNVGALVEPSKGDGVFWYNLFRNGNGNDDTRHAACPVLVGTKWVANKWIHEKGQEFRYKCSLSEWE